MFKKLMTGVLLASLAITAAVPAVNADAEGKGQIKSNKDVVERLVGFNSYNDGRLDTLIAAVTCDYFGGAVVDTLVNADRITLFAPTDYAFRKLGRSVGVKGGVTPANVCRFDELIGRDGDLEQILLHHVHADQKLWCKRLKGRRGTNITMLDGQRDAIGGTGSTVSWVDGTMKVKNIRSSNAIVHVVDEVGLPPLGIPR